MKLKKNIHKNPRTEYSFYDEAQVPYGFYRSDGGVCYSNGLTWDNVFGYVVHCNVKKFYI